MKRVKQNMNYFLVTLCFILLLLELSFSLFLQTQFTGVLPSQSLLSCKDNKIETITLLQKALSPLVRRLLLFYPQVSVWINCIIETLLSVIRCKSYFTSLNPYNLDSLYYQAHFLVAILSMNIVCLMQIPLHEVVADMNFVLVAWIILTIFAIKISNSYLKNRVLKLLLFQENSSGPMLLVHKIIATNYLLKKASAPISCSEKCDLTHLVRNTLQERVQESFGGEQVPDLLNKQARREFFCTYLENLSKTYPKNEFLKLYTAYFYAKKLKIYGLCLKLLAELRHSSSWKINVSSSILYHDIQNKIIHEYQNHLFALNLNDFMNNKILISKTRMRIIEQTSLQIRICEEILEPHPNYANLQNFSQKVNKIKNEIERASIPDYNLELLLIYTYYYLVVNHSYEEYQHYSDLYFKIIQRHEKSQNSNAFSKENLYTEDVGLLICSGQREASGKILYCGGNYQQIFGKNLTGEHLSVIATPILRPDINQLLKGLLEKGVSPCLDVEIPRFLYNKRGYMTQVNCYTNINPYSSQGMTYCVIYKTLQTHKEFLLINEDGGVECFTKNIAEKLNLFALKNREERNIGFVCPDLERVIHAFNMIAYPERKIKKFATRSDKFITMESSQETPHFKKKSPRSVACRKQIMLSQGEAQALFKLYSEGEGQILIFERYQSSKKYAFRCTMKNILAGDKVSVTKEVTLENIDIDLPPHLGSNNLKTHPDDDTSPKADSDFDELRVKNSPFQPSSFRIQPLSTCRTAPSSRFLLAKVDSQASHYLHDPRRTSSSNQVKLEPQLQYQKSQTSSNVNQPAPSLHTDWLSLSKLKSAKAFKQAVQTPYSPSIYKISKTLISLAIALIFISQLYFGIKTNSALDNLNASKQILQTAQTRNHYLIDIHGHLLILLGSLMGQFTIEQLRPGLNGAFLVNSTRTSIENLKRVNLGDLEAEDSIDPQAREVIFRKDVKIYETYFDSPEQKYINLTNFQATNEIVETSLKALSKIKTNPSDSIAYLKFVLRNLMNDPLTKDFLIADTFFTSFLMKKQESISTLYLNFSLCCGLLLIAVVQMLLPIIYQCKSASKNMLALTKLNKSAIQSVMITLQNFQDLLQRNIPVKKGLKDKSPQYLARNHMGASNLKMVKFRYEQKSIKNHHSLKKQSILISTIVFVIAFAVIGLLAGYLTIIKGYFEDLETHTEQIYFIEKMDAKIDLTRNSLFEMVFTNNTSLVQDELVSVVLEREMKEIQVMKNQLYERFGAEKDFRDGDFVQLILFSDACQYFQQNEGYYKMCKGLGNNLEKVSLLNLVNNAEALFQDFYLEYMTSNKTSDYLKYLQVTNYQKIVSPLYYVFQPLSSMISNGLNENFMSDLVRCQYVNKAFLIGISLSFAIAYYMLKFVILKLLSSKENEFRRMLLLFPANVVLSNFMLKSYLTTTSKSSSFDFKIHE